VLLRFDSSSQNRLKSKPSLSIYQCRMTAHQIVARAKNLPRISPAGLKLVELLDQPEDGTGEAMELIRSDPHLTAKLLRVCNSSALALAQPVSSIDQAVLLLGYNQVLSYVLSLAFGGSMTAALPGYGLHANDLWLHSFMAATAAQNTVNQSLYLGIEPSVAFTAGLLHDIGKLVMAEALTPEAQSAIHRHRSGEGLGSIEAEREVLGTDHAEVGACLLHIWRLPDWIVEAVANHHQPALEPSPQLSAIAHLANRIAHLAEQTPDAEAYAFQSTERIVQVFELNIREQEDMLASVRQAVEHGMSLIAMV
jgi:putative nucleotidyltransferase with HDIG domain